MIRIALKQHLAGAALFGMLALAASGPVAAQTDSGNTPDAAAPGARVSGAAPSNQVVVTGVVPDQATKAAVLERLRALYGKERVIDEVTVGNVVAPPNWSTYLSRMLVPDLTDVSRGRLVINGNSATIEGDVGNEAQRQTVVSNMAKQLNPSYSIENNLAVGSSKQEILDKALANRTITFETGSAELTDNGRQIVNEMAAALKKLDGRTVEIIGHTDNNGARQANLALSEARAQSVKQALVAKGIDADSLITLGAGEQRPIASNETPEGRARNRRIEFRIQGQSAESTDND
ncbi:OmpA family protein [Salinisphaera sp. Q1T1-3]|uniref:OmpA family protein n=1 Tax=Salinisphaera sp. Q1T1-3 TaxID=2321229 RepID=UPI0018F3E5DD|nr:OmpA family protein [Salinisphaera sp. Q1T1-3]